MPHLAARSSFAASGSTVAGFRLLRGPAPPPRYTPLRARAASAAGGGVRAVEPTFYELLGIPAEGSSFEDVRAAYRQMARRYHPDVSPPGAAGEHTRRFIQVQEAYETLSDPGRRSGYDRALALGVCRLAFNPASRNVSSLYRQELEEKSGWRTSWEGQITELKKRSTGKDSEENLSWGAQMRRSRAEQL
uniref:Uncharacterized protein n=1 Tax=Avena sativa TaxID=4498 RepID=A0ACD5WN44_AVESA